MKGVNQFQRFVNNTARLQIFILVYQEVNPILQSILYSGAVKLIDD